METTNTLVTILSANSEIDKGLLTLMKLQDEQMDLMFNLQFWSIALISFIIFIIFVCFNYRIDQLEAKLNPVKDENQK